MTSAGVAVPGYFEDIALSAHHEAMSINYFGTLYAVRAVFPYLKESAGGRIVLISSGAGLVGVFGYSAYSPSKFAVKGLAESIRIEAERCNIQVSVVYPPDCDTPQLQKEMETKPAETISIAGDVKIWRTEDVPNINKC